jgi:hypothetical protein
MLKSLLTMVMVAYKDQLKPYRLSIKPNYQLNLQIFIII